METELQKYLRAGNSVESLVETYGINVYAHDTLPLLGFKYSQIDSPKTEPVVRASRGTVLEKDTWNLVAQPFFRFFNLGEHLDETKNFNWAKSSGTVKEDGSLCIVYHYDGAWHMNTSGSFATQECGFSKKSWSELFFETAQLNFDKMDTNYTYLFEMWTIHNKVVRIYDYAQVFLLGAINRETFHDVPNTDLVYVAEDIGVKTPYFFVFESSEEVISYIRRVEEKDPTFEGIVLRDDTDMRIKVKSDTYVALHHFADNGNVGNPKRIIPLVLANEVDELLTYFPEVEEHVREVEAQINEAYDKLLALWQGTYTIEEQKDFALAIVRETPFSGLLFSIRKNKGLDQCEDDLKEIWRNSADTIFKVLYKGRD
jgi:hypothetical protein